MIVDFKKDNLLGTIFEIITPEGLVIKSLTKDKTVIVSIGHTISLLHEIRVIPLVIGMMKIKFFITFT